MACTCHHREYTISIICITVVFLFADQNLLAPNLTLIANEFGFTNAERDDLLGGKIAIGFFIIGGFISIIAGYLADTVNRIVLFAVVVFIGESACLATYWSTTYNQLYICRVFTGISIGGATPIVFSILADLYESESRTKVSTLVGIAMSSGIAFGQMMAGFLGPKYGWRLPFVLVAAPALIFAVLILLTGTEPHRGSQEEEVRLLRSEINTNINMANQYMVRDQQQQLSSSTSSTVIPFANHHHLKPSSSSPAVMVSTWSDPETQTTETAITSTPAASTIHNPLHDSYSINNSAYQNSNHHHFLSQSQSQAQPQSTEQTLYHGFDSDKSTGTTAATDPIYTNTLRHNPLTLSQSRNSILGISTDSSSSRRHIITSSHHSPRHCYNSASSLGISTSGTAHHPLLPSSSSSSDVEVHYSEKIDCTKICNLFTNKSAVLVFMQGVPACLPWGMVYTFLNDYFSADKHLSVMSATIALTMFGFGGLFGQLGGGLLGQQLYNIDKRYQCVLMGTTTILSTLPMLYLLNTITPGDGLFYIVAILGGFLVSMNGPNVRAVLQNVCTPETRGSAFALFNLTDDIGKGAGPWLVVQLIKACGQDRKTAFNIVTCFWVLGGMVLLLLVCTVEDDERIVQNKVRESLLRNHQLLHVQNMMIAENGEGGGGDGSGIAAGTAVVDATAVGEDGTLWTSYVLDTTNDADDDRRKSEYSSNNVSGKDVNGGYASNSNRDRSSGVSRSGKKNSNNKNNGYMSCSTNDGGDGDDDNNDDDEDFGIHSSSYQQPPIFPPSLHLSTSRQLSQSQHQQSLSSPLPPSYCPMCGGIRPLRITTTYATGISISNSSSISRSMKRSRLISSSTVGNAAVQPSLSLSQRAILLSSASSVQPLPLSSSNTGAAAAAAAMRSLSQSTSATMTSTTPAAVNLDNVVVCMCAHFPSSYCSSPQIYSSSESPSPAPAAVAARAAAVAPTAVNETEHSPLIPNAAATSTDATITTSEAATPNNVNSNTNSNK